MKAWRKGMMWLAAMMVVMMAGCRKNPESPIVEDKDMEELVEEAQSSGGQRDVDQIAKD